MWFPTFFLVLLWDPQNSCKIVYEKLFHMLAGHLPSPFLNSVKLAQEYTRLSESSYVMVSTI